MNNQRAFLDEICFAFEKQNPEKIEPDESNQIGEILELTPIQTRETLTALANSKQISMLEGVIRRPQSTQHASPGTSKFLNMGEVKGDAVQGNKIEIVGQNPSFPVGDLISLIRVLRTETPRLSEEDRTNSETLVKDAQDALDTLRDENSSEVKRKSTLSKVNNNLKRLTETDKHIRSLTPKLKVIAAGISKWPQAAGWMS